VVTRGIAGGITSGATYFGIVVGSSDPPGNAAAAADAGIRHGTATETPAAALAFKNVRRVITAAHLLRRRATTPHHFQSIKRVEGGQRWP